MNEGISIEWLSDILRDHPALQDNPERLESLRLALIERQHAHTPIPVMEPQKTINAQIDGFRRRLVMTNAKANLFYDDVKTQKSKAFVDEIALLVSDVFGTLSFNDQVFFYDGARRIYTNNIGRYKAIIDVLCDECERRGMIPQLQEQVIKHLQGINVYHEYPFNSVPNLIPFDNCCVKFNGTGQWLQQNHSFQNFLTWILPLKYNSGLNHQIVYDVLNQWVEPEDVQFLIQIPAQALLQMNHTQPYKKSYLLSGGRDAAKSTYLDVLKKFFGEALICSVPLQEIGQRFTHAILEGKAINVYDDLADRALSDLGLFKALTGTFKHDIERKHEKVYSGYINCVHIFSCNKPPKVPDANDEAFWSRWEYIVFPNTFDRDPSWFAKTITDEWLSAFAELVLIEYVRILNHGLNNKNTPVMVRDSWLAESTSEYMFVNSMLVKGMGETIRTDTCFSLYQKWCVSQNKNIDDERVFGRVLSTMGFSKSRPRSGDKRYHVYVGIGVPEALKPQISEPETSQKVL